MRDYAARKTQLETRLNELDTRIHKIEDRLDDPVTKDWQDQAIERADLVKRLEKIEDRLDDPKDPDVEERATEREEDEVLEFQGNAGLKEMEMIRAALARIEADTYGDCLKCGAEISDARLDIVPHAALCRDCARGT